MGNDKNNLAAYMAGVMGKIYSRPRFGNPVYMGGDVVLDPGGTGRITLKASASRDLLVQTISCSQDGTPVDRLDPWQMDVFITSILFTSELKDNQMEHVIDGEIPIGDLFGRDTGEQVLDLIKRNEDVTFEFRNADVFMSHRVNVSLRCAFWPPILYGLKTVTDENLFEPRPD